MIHRPENAFASEEIDLLEVLKKIIRIYTRWKKFILITFLACTVLSVLFFLVMPKTYLTRMYVASNLLKGPSFIVLMDDLQKHIKEKNYEVAAAYMNMEVEVVKEITMLEFYTARNFAEKEFADLITQTDAELEKDTKNNEFVIQAYISDNAIAKKLEDGIIYYIENNNFSKMQSTNRKESLNKVGNRISSELAQLDSLRNSLTDIYTKNARSGGQGSIIMNDPSAIYNNILLLFQTQTLNTSELNTPDIIVIQGFVTYKKQYSPRLGICLLSGILGGLALITIFVTYHELKRKLAEPI